MLIQETMIDRVREVCGQDDRVVAALMYGSFAYGEGDEYSDIEFVLFLQDDALSALDLEAWVAQIAPVELFFRDDFGHYTVIFDNLVRGEFHFHRASEMRIVDAWRGSVFFPSLESCLIVDRTGELRQHLAPLALRPGDPGAGGRAQAIQWMFANLILFGSNTLARGEVARALDILSVSHRYLLWMVRLVEGTTEHWPSPARVLERDISPASYARYVRCTAPADAQALLAAYRAAWAWGLELGAVLADRFGRALPESLTDKIAARMSGASPAKSD